MHCQPIHEPRPRDVFTARMQMSQSLVVILEIDDPQAAGHANADCHQKDQQGYLVQPAVLLP